MFKNVIFCCVLLGAAAGVLGSHFRGGIIMVRPQPGGNETEMEIFYHISWRRENGPKFFCDTTTIANMVILDGEGALNCHFGCGGIISLMNYFCTDFSVVEDWSFGENRLTYTFQALPSITIGFKGNAWIPPFNGRWNISTTFSTMIRNDTGTINSSPRAITAPVIRLQQRCNMTFQIPVNDPDGDTIRCRLAQGSECESICNGFPAAILDEASCSLSYNPTLLQDPLPTQIQAVAVMIEDFLPGSTTPLSSVALQFLVLITNPDQPCTAGPEFVPPTLTQGTCVAIPPGETFTTTIFATSGSVGFNITEIQTVSPSGFTSSAVFLVNGTLYGINITWTPTIQQHNETHTFCYTAINSLFLASSQVCIMLQAGAFPPTPIQATAMPRGVAVQSSMPTFHISFDKEINRPSSSAFIRFYDQDTGMEVYRIDTSVSSEVSFNMTHIYFIPNYTFKARYFYIKFDRGIGVGLEGCMLENEPVHDSTFWIFHIIHPTSLPESHTLVIEGTIAELSTLTLHCQFSGYGLSDLTWLRQIGQEVQTMDLLIRNGRATVSYMRNDSSFPPTRSSTLQISDMTQADDGEYICVAIRMVASESIQIPISIPAVNDCLNTPCQNNGKCKDRVAGYECVCVDGFTGIHCSETVIVEAVKMPNITQPPQSQNHSLGQPVNLTCGADGNPPPLYQWFKDGTDIPGAYFPYLYIGVVTPGDRGNYTCTASNEGGTATSPPGLLSITEVYQFIAELDISGNLNMTVEELILKTVGTTTEGVTVYSMRILSSMSRTASLLVTVQSGADSENIASALSTWLSSVASSATVEPLQIVRYDGCPKETLPLLSSSLLAGGDNSTTYSWPETEIGDPVLYQPCPNQVGSNSNNTVSRYCGGSFSSGAQWSDVDFSQCSVWAAEILSKATSQPEVLQSDAVSETAKVIETVLTDAAIADPMVTEQYLNIIDNIQQVNESVVQESERETGVSKRILNSLGRFQDEIVLSKNVTAPIVYAQKSFALQIQDVTTQSFDGETFNVDLGSFEKAIRINTSIPEKALQTTMEVLSNVTASISLPPSLLSDLQGGMEVRRDEAVQRLSYSVFLTDALFQSPNQTARNLSIGTIIVALRLRSVTVNQTLTIPINTTFRINEEVQGAQSSSCVHWEASAKFGEWSDADCTEVEGRQGERMCQCRRPTAHFAVLFDLNPAPPPAGVATALEVITYFGLVVSILSLLLMIVTYFCSKNLRSSLHGQIILNLCFALLGLYLFFLIAAHVTTVPGLCGLVSALLHYFILVFFAWTAAEAVYLYIKLVKVMGVDKYVRGYMWKAGLPAWIVPAMIVLISLAGYQYYTSKYYCRPTQWPFFFGLILPFVLVYLFNWVMFVIILASILHHTQNHAATLGDKSGKLRAIRQKVIIALTLSLVFGLGWGLGLLATSTRVIGITIGFQVIFTLFVGAQGLLMLVFHGFRSEKAREVWKQWLNFVTRRHKTKAYGSGASTLDTMKQSTLRSSRKSEGNPSVVAESEASVM